MKVSTVTHLLIAAFVVVFFNLEPRPGFVAAFICSPARLADGSGYYTLVTSLFIHRDVWHLAVNAAGVWLMSWGLERLRWFEYLALFTAGGAFSHLVQALFCLAFTLPFDGIAGASGAVAVFVGAQVGFYPKRRLTVFVFGIERRPLFAWGAVAWGCGELVALALPATRVAHVAHVAGLVFGYALATLLRYTHGGQPEQAGGGLNLCPR